MTVVAVADGISGRPASLLSVLAENGWARHSVGGASILEEIGRLGDALGSRAGGRSGSLQEEIVPQSSEHAHPRSLSAHHGYSALPFHVELSHRPSPCRYVLLGCIDPGFPGAVTMLVDWQSLGFTADELRLLESAPVLVRSGRRSFYSTILPANRRFFRFDPGCLESVNASGRNALDIVAYRLRRATPINHQWQRGDLLVIDNWRVLHGRGPTNQGSGRRLARILIDG